jgi:hypothetical protein
MRIRSIKPEFWRSDDITALSREHRLLFIGLWSYVDDNGVGIDDHRQIAADLFALEDDLKEARDFVREGLATLAQAGLITRYTSEHEAPGFAEFWQRYPRKEKRQDAERAWKTHVIRRRVYQRALFDALDAHIRHWRDRYGDDTQYVPLAPTWLRNERWTDELPGHPAAAQEVNLHTVDDYLDHAAGTEAARLLGVAYLPDPQPPSDQTAPREWEREAARRWITHHAAALRERLAQLKDTG